GAAAYALVDVEDHAAFHRELVTVDADALAIDDDVALAEVAEGNRHLARAIGNVVHALVDLDGIAEQRVLDALDEIAGRGPQAATVLILNAHQAGCRGRVHQPLRAGFVRPAQLGDDVDAGRDQIGVGRRRGVAGGDILELAPGAGE